MLLALDTATPLVTVALHDGTDVVVELTSDRAMKHGEQLAPLIEEALRRVDADRFDLTAIAVGVGPGPFTGLRVGLVTARMLGWALGVPVQGVCTLDVLAVEAVATGAIDPGAALDAHGDADGFVVATDARRKEVYLAAYDPQGVRLAGPVVDRPSEVATRTAVVGAGALLYPAEFPNAVGPTRPAAGWLAHAVTQELVELYDPEPMYLRRPDAVVPGPRKPAS